MLELRIEDGRDLKCESVSDLCLIGTSLTRTVLDVYEVWPTEGVMEISNLSIDQEVTPRSYLREDISLQTGSRTIDAVRN